MTEEDLNKTLALQSKIERLKEVVVMIERAKFYEEISENTKQQVRTLMTADAETQIAALEAEFAAL